MRAALGARTRLSGLAPGLMQVARREGKGSWASRIRDFQGSSGRQPRGERRNASSRETELIKSISARSSGATAGGRPSGVRDLVPALRGCGQRAACVPVWTGGRVGAKGRTCYCKSPALESRRNLPCKGRTEPRCPPQEWTGRRPRILSRCSANCVSRRKRLLGRHHACEAGVPTNTEFARTPAACRRHPALGRNVCAHWRPSQSGYLLAFITALASKGETGPAERKLSRTAQLEWGRGEGREREQSPAGYRPRGVAPERLAVAEARRHEAARPAEPAKSGASSLCATALAGRTSHAGLLLLHHPLCFASIDQTAGSDLRKLLAGLPRAETVWSRARNKQGAAVTLRRLTHLLAHLFVQPKARTAHRPRVHPSRGPLRNFPPYYSFEPAVKPTRRGAQNCPGS